MVLAPAAETKLALNAVAANVAGELCPKKFQAAIGAAKTTSV